MTRVAAALQRFRTEQDSQQRLWGGGYLFCTDCVFCFISWCTTPKGAAFHCNSFLLCVCGMQQRCYCKLYTPPSWECNSYACTGRFTPRETRYTLRSILGGPQSRSERCEEDENPLAPAGNRTEFPCRSVHSLMEPYWLSGVCCKYSLLVHCYCVKVGAEFFPETRMLLLTHVLKKVAITVRGDYLPVKKMNFSLSTPLLG